MIIPNDVVSHRLGSVMGLVTTSSAGLVVERQLKQCMYENTQYM